MKRLTLMDVFETVDAQAARGARVVDWLVTGLGVDADTAIAEVAGEIDALITPDQRTYIGRLIERHDGPLAKLLLTRAYDRLQAQLAAA